MQIDDHPEPHIHSQSLICVVLSLQSDWSLCMILFENQIQTTSTSPCRTQVQPVASFLVCSLIFIEYEITIHTDRRNQ